MKQIKRIGAIVLALVMMFALTATAFADNQVATLTASNASSASEGNVLVGASFTVTVDKQDDVHMPGTRFSYSITNGEAKDATSTSPAIKAGIGAVTFGSQDTETNVTKTVGTPATSITVDLAADTTSATLKLAFGAHTNAGIYRYIITQAALNTAQTNAGFKTEDGTATAVAYYLDVYVNNTGAVYATALAKALPTEEGKTQLENNSKVAGFKNLYSFKENGSDPDDPGNKDSYDVTVKKTLGTSGAEDASYAFPFTVQVTVPYDATYLNTNGMTFSITNTDTTFANSFTIPANNNGAAVTFSGTMIGGKQIVIKGLPAGTVVKVKETTNAYENYDITSNVTDMDSSAGITTAVHTEAADANYVTTGTVKGNVSTDGQIEYVNARSTISPTGLVLRFAPFALLLVCALFLVVFARKRKADDRA